MALTLNQVQTAKTGSADAISRAATIRLDTNNNSINQRLRYYEDVLTHFSSNPIFGRASVTGSLLLFIMTERILMDI